jgi:UDP-hydrolysing UDP-N-acetyl-D-glucosamine 2-epimerase
MRKRKIAVITGSRAEYGLLYWTMREIQDDPELELQVVVTGMHLSPEFGNTYRFIEEDGFKIAAKVEMLVSSDTASGTAKSMGLCLISMTDTLHQLMPDMIVLLGDRFESLAIAQAALVQKIPIAHIHGGELSEGAIDDAIRHAITKMSHLHFVAADAYRDRVIQLGEHPNNVFNFGTPGLEQISRMKLHDRQTIEKVIGRELKKQNFLVTYHSATLDLEETNQVLENLFKSLAQYPDALVIFTKANADEGGRFINRKLEEYVTLHPDRASLFASLGHLNYLSLIPFVDIVIGNSSSGIIEVPLFKKPTINIGTRQNKRLRASTIIDCDGYGDSLINAIKFALSKEFQANLQHPVLAYTQDTTAAKIKTAIKAADLQKLIIKQFYDMETI